MTRNRMWVEDNMKIKVKVSVRNYRANELLGHVYSNVYTMLYGTYGRTPRYKIIPLMFMNISYLIRNSHQIWAILN